MEILGEEIPDHLREAGELRLQHKQASLEELGQRAHVFEMHGGETVFMPMAAAHAVKTGGDVSVTFSMLMNTPSSMLEADIWRANYRLRKLGLDPLPFGESRLRDALKARALRAIRGVRDFVSGTEAAANASPWY